MKILETLGNEKLSTKKKLKAIKKFVATIRETYGNADIKIDPIKVMTIDGAVPLSLLTNEEKVAIATSRIKSAVTIATIIAADTQGVKFDRVLESKIAVDATLCNLDEEVDSQY